MVASIAMTSACATSSGTKPLPRDPDPIVETRTVVQRVCPAELLAPVPAKPKRPAGDGASLTGDAATLGWIGAIVRWADEIASLLADAKLSCTGGVGREFPR
jgi:hypothetical protein